MTADRKSPPSTLVLASILMAIVLAAALPCARADATNSPPTDADQAWKEVERALQPPPLPAEWGGQRPTAGQVEEFRAEQGRLAGVAADKARDFYTRFPNHPKTATARQKQQDMLQVAVRLGNTGKAADLEQIETEKLKDPNLSEDERFKLRMTAVNRRLATL